MQLDPKVSVLMPVYNAAFCIGDALQSIFRQAMVDFEVIIVDDGSSDNTIEIVKNFNDSRVKIVRMTRNVGPINAANIGLGEVNSSYIIRMDADDISLPGRFEKQYLYMESHPEVGVCGTGVRTSGKGSKEIIKPADNETILSCMLFSNPVAFSSAIIRSDILKEKGFRYRDKFPHMAEYDLWYRLKNVTQFANLQEVLVQSAGQHRKTTETEEHSRELRASFFLDKLIALGIKPNTEELDIHLDLTEPVSINKARHPSAYKVWLDKLRMINQITYSFPRDTFNKILDDKWKMLEKYFQKDGYKLIEYDKLSGKNNVQALTDMLRKKIKHIFNL